MNIVVELSKIILGMCIFPVCLIHFHPLLNLKIRELQVVSLINMCPELQSK